MARVNNLSNFLTDVANAIKTKKGSETAIPAASFDTEILTLPSQGTYEQRVLNISANGTQTITPSSGYDAIDELELTVAVPEKQLQSKTYNFIQNTNIQLLPDSGYDGFDTVTLNINVPSSTINNQDKTITQNGAYTADSGYTGLGTVTVNVPSGSGDVKLFETIVEMQADPNPSEGDLAVVYREELQPITSETEFDSCIFPNEVVLDEAFTGSISGGFGATEQGVVFAATVEVSSSGFRFSDYVKSEIIAQYTSQDGITYTRTDGGEELVEFGTTIKWESFFGPFNSVIGNFMKIGRMVFEGLYEYKTNQYVIAPTQLTLLADKLLPDIIGYGKNGITVGTMPNNGALSYTPSTSQQSIPAGYTSGGTVGAVTSAIDSNIQAGNIKRGVTILGVEGTYDGPGYDPNLVLDTLDAGGAEQYLGGTPITDITNVVGFDALNANGDSILYYVMKTVTARSNMTGFSMNNIRVLDNGVIQWIPYGNNTVFNTDDFLECTITCTDAYNNIETKIITIYNSEKENYPGPDDPEPDDPGEWE